MFKCKKKKTGVQTPEFRKPTPPPPTPKMNNLIRSRLWLDKDTHIVVRNWTDDEHQTVDPHTHIFEKYWSYRCPICSFLPTPCCDENEVRRAANSHRLHCGDKHKCKVEYRDHELVCLETREEFLEGCGAWIIKQEIY